MKKIIPALLLLLSPLFTSSVNAATTNGTLGASSTGNIDIVAVIGNLIIIQGLSTINLGTFTVGSDMTGNTTACVYTNRAGGLYNVTISGDGGDGSSSAFNLSDGTGNFLPYEVTYTAGAVTTPLSTPPPVTLTNRQGSTASQTCGGTPNTTIAVRVLQANAAAVPAATYNGILTVLVAAI